MNTRQEYINQLKIREKQLLEDLTAIRKLLSSEGAIETESPSNGKIKTLSKPEGIPKGKNDWEKYTLIILKTLGGRAKSQSVIEYAVKANPKINEDKITDAIRGKLSKLGKAGTVAVEKGASKSEGYEYIIKDIEQQQQELDELMDKYKTKK